MRTSYSSDLLKKETEEKGSEETRMEIRKILIQVMFSAED